MTRRRSSGKWLRLKSKPGMPDPHRLRLTEYHLGSPSLGPTSRKTKRSERLNSAKRKFKSARRKRRIARTSSVYESCRRTLFM
jgi:hypothetical protein